MTRVICEKQEKVKSKIVLFKTKGVTNKRKERCLAESDLGVMLGACLYEHLII